MASSPPQDLNGHAPAKGGSLNVSGHIPALDGLRGLAILLVIWGHLTVMGTWTLVDRVYMHMAGLGWSGVDLFFVLSGFLITGILLDSKSSPSYFKNYYIRRVLRIFPLYYAVVFMCLVVLPHLPHPKLNNFGRIAGDEWFYWMHLSNISTALSGKYRHGILDVCWSLAIEEQFYLVWPAVIYLVLRATLKKICICMFGIALASRLALVWWIAPENHLAPYMITPCRIDSLGWGAFVAILAREPAGVARLVPYAKRWCLPLLTLAVGITAVERLDPTYQFFDYGAGMGRYSLSFFYSLSAPAFAGLLVLCIASKPGTVLNRVMTTRFMRTFGKYSYALYLFHMPCRAFVRDVLYGPEHFQGKIKFFQIAGSELPGQLLFYVVGLLPAMGLAWLSWRVFESPILGLKRYFPSGRAPAKAVPGVAPSAVLVHPEQVDDPARSALQPARNPA
jgi:peptidoglycan/LPS O-acetylase OafA/YrhL